METGSIIEDVEKTLKEKIIFIATILVRFQFLFIGAFLFAIESDHKCYVSNSSNEPLSFEDANNPDILNNGMYEDVARSFTIRLWILFSASFFQSASFFYKIYLEYYRIDEY